MHALKIMSQGDFCLSSDFRIAIAVHAKPPRLRTFFQVKRVEDRSRPGADTHNRHPTGSGGEEFQK